MESVTAEEFHSSAAEKEEVLAMRVSGLKDPSLLAVGCANEDIQRLSTSRSAFRKNCIWVR